MVAGITTAVIVAGAFAYVDAEQQKTRYEPGFARIEGYALGDTPTQLVIYFVSGPGDLVEGPSVTEGVKDVRVAVRTSVFVPGRGTFKNLSGTLGRTTISLRDPTRGASGYRRDYRNSGHAPACAALRRWDASASAGSRGTR